MKNQKKTKRTERKNAGMTTRRTARRTARRTKEEFLFRRLYQVCVQTRS